MIWVAALAMVWTLPALPTQDGPSHAYFLGVLSDLMAGRGPWSEFYRADLQLRPYLGLVAIGLPLSAAMPLEAVERTIVMLYGLLLAAGVPALLRAVGRPALPLAFLTVPLAFNLALFMGFYSYCLAAALYILALAALWRWRDRPLAWRAAATTAIALGLWAVHLIAALFLLASAALIEVTRPRRPPSAVYHVAAPVSVAAPGLIAIVLLTLPHVDRGALVVAAWHPLAVRAFFLATFGSVALGPRQLAVSAALLAWLLLVMPWSRLARDHADRFLCSVGCMLAAAVLLMPNAALSGGYVNERVPWLIPLVLAPVLRPPTAWRLARLRALHGPFLAALAGTALALVAAEAWPLAHDLALLRRGVAADLAPGSTALLARFTARPLWPLHDPLLHAASRYGARGLIDVGYAAADVQYFPVRLRAAALAEVDPDAVYRSPRGIDWDGSDAPDYLLAWGADTTDQARLAMTFLRAWSEAGNPLTIWRRR